MKQITRFVFSDIFRNRFIVVYTLLLAALSWSVFQLEDTGQKGILTMLNLQLLVVPLVSILFSTIYLYNSNEFIELLISQPVNRSKIWQSIFLGLTGSFSLGWLLATGIPLFLFTDLESALVMCSTGMLISIIFIAMAFLAATITRDKAKGVGIAIVIWLYFSMFFDGFVLWLSFQFSDYPIEKPMVFLSSINPVDLVRIINLTNLDASAMMGYTGAIFSQYFSGITGYALALTMLLFWAVVPYFVSQKKFRKKDL